jgi:hypothetical protein
MNPFHMLIILYLRTYGIRILSDPPPGWEGDIIIPLGMVLFMLISYIAKLRPDNDLFNDRTLRQLPGGINSFRDIR